MANAIRLRQSPSGPELEGGNTGDVATKNADGTVSFLPPAGGGSITGHQQSNPDDIGPASTVGLDTDPFTPLSSGKYLVMATIAGAAGGPMDQDTTLFADADSIAEATVSSGTTGGYQCTLIAYVTLTLDTPHTFSISSNSSDGTSTVPAGSAKIVWVELG